MVEAGSTMVVAKNDFDRLISEGNYREILKRQYEFAPAINGDPRPAVEPGSFIGKRVVTPGSKIHLAPPEFCVQVPALEIDFAR